MVSISSTGTISWQILGEPHHAQRPPECPWRLQPSASPRQAPCPARPRTAPRAASTAPPRSGGAERGLPAPPGSRRSAPAAPAARSPLLAPSQRCPGSPRALTAPSLAPSLTHHAAGPLPLPGAAKVYLGSGRGAAAGPPGRAGGGRAGGASPQTQSEPARAAPSPEPRGAARRGERGAGSGEGGARPPPPRAARLQQRGLLRAAAPGCRSRLGSRRAVGAFPRPEAF